METENPYDADWDGTNDEYRWNEGYTAAVKDLTAERDKQQKLITAYMDERAGLMAEVDRLKAAISEAVALLNAGVFEAINLYQLAKSITPQPADYFEQPTQGTEPAITQRKSTKHLVGEVTPPIPHAPPAVRPGAGGK